MPKSKDQDELNKIAEILSEDSLGQVYPSCREVLFGTKKILSAVVPRPFNESALLEYTLLDRAPLDNDLYEPSVNISSLIQDGFRTLEPELIKVMDHSNALSALDSLFDSLTEIRRMITCDIKAAYRGDPAASSHDEVILTYPSILCVSAHRLAHSLYINGVPLIPRIMSEWAHSKTGIDIHPGAKIDEGFFIDHGTGVVIGETTVIGKNVKIYQGVTLGARSFSADENGNLIRGEKRHPTVEDNVVIYANATILGGNTVIGADSIIGGNVFIVESVPPNSKILARDFYNK
ncbi:MAG TPA: serine acetyltransferase [Oligoflexia bacterium]|nr:serine acetyltransferase [Oligoflexia bacterium]HMP47809.1 serine acetyltransferase [Oligoflexia bacterium]